MKSTTAYLTWIGKKLTLPPVSMMRYLKIIFTLTLIFPARLSHAQTVLDVQLTDQFKRPLAFAVINYAGILTTTSNQAGFFRINNYVPAAKISIHKFGFADTTIVVNPNLITGDTVNMTVVLRFKPLQLPEVSVSPEIKKEINPLRADFVVGYELTGDYLVELLSDGHILLIDKNNQVLKRSRLNFDATDIIKDPAGSIHITSDKSAQPVSVDSTGIREKALPLAIDKFNWEHRYCDDATETTRFVRRYKDHNQTVAFFAMLNMDSRNAVFLKEISDVHKRDAVNAFVNETNSLLSYLAVMTETNPAGVMGPITGEELYLFRLGDKMVSQLENNYALPSYNFLKMVNDSIFLFAHDVDSMFVYDKALDLVRTKRINYHHLKIWDKELIVNEERTKVYAKLVDHAKPMIAEVDLKTGELKPPFVVINARYPSRIRIRHGTAYFMAKQKDGIGYSVYAQLLE